MQFYQPTFPLISKLFYLLFIMGVYADPPGENWNLLWSDEFDGTGLDNTKWAPCPEWFRQGGSYWEADNIYLTGDSQLRLDVTEVDGTVYCGAIRTRDIYQQKFGYFEVRCKLPQIRGGWSAFWMMPNDQGTNDEGRDGTELDIFESINGWRGMVNHALHWDGYGPEHQSKAESIDRPDLYDDEFHTFGLWWKADEYIFYIDGEESWRTTAGGVSQVEQYIKLTLEVSNADWPGSWSDQVEKPIHWYVDYVRTYQKGPPTWVIGGQMDNGSYITIEPGNSPNMFAIGTPQATENISVAIYNSGGAVITRLGSNNSNPVIWDASHNMKGIYFISASVNRLPVQKTLKIIKD